MNSRRIYDVHALLAECKQGYHPDYVFFWKPVPAVDGQIGKGCLCQWWVAPFLVEGVRYDTAEHFMMAEKARLFGDFAIHEKILSTASPRLVKELGRQIKGFDTPTWVLRRTDIVTRGNMAKFGQHDDLREYLLATGEKILVEASPYDTIWGIGRAEDDPCAASPEQWNGLNLLGFALMLVRDQLAAVA